MSNGYLISGQNAVPIVDAIIGFNAPMFVTALSSFTSPSDRFTVSCDGYSVVSDGGGGVFVWNATDMRPTDGGTVFQVTGVTTGRWNRLMTDTTWLNVLWFGAKATGRPSNGGFDNTAAFTLAINAANTQGLTIFCPPDVANLGYGFAAGSAATDPLPLLTTCKGLLGGTEGVQTILDFDNVDGSCLVFRGCNIIQGINANNHRTSSLTNSSGVLHIINANTGKYDRVSTAEGATNNRGIFLEQRYDEGEVTSVVISGGVPTITVSISSWAGEAKQHAKFQLGEQVQWTAIGGVTFSNTVDTIASVSYGTNTITFTPSSVTASGVYTSGGKVARAADVYALRHVRCWYNNFTSITTGYLSVGADVGYGLAFEVNANAVSVSNIADGSMGPYTGDVGYNKVINLDTEGQERGVNLSYATGNTFIGGQYLGNAVQLYGSNANSNTFLGTKHNQWATSMTNFDGTTCAGNAWFNPILSTPSDNTAQVGPDNTVANTFGSNPVWIASGSTSQTLDGVGGGASALSLGGMIGDFYSNNDMTMRLRPIGYWNGSSPVEENRRTGVGGWHVSSGSTNFWALGPREDNTGLAAIYAFPDTSAPAGTNPVLSSDGTNTYIGPTSTTGKSRFMLDGSPVGVSVTSAGLTLGTSDNIILSYPSVTGVLKVESATPGSGGIWPTGGYIYRPDGSGVSFATGNGLNEALGIWKQYDTSAAHQWVEESGNRVTTTDATNTDLVAYTVPTNSTVLVDFQVTSRRTGGSAGVGSVGDSAGFWMKVLVKNVSGTVTLIDSPAGGSASADWSDASTAANYPPSYTVAVAGTTVKVQVAWFAALNGTHYAVYRAECINAS